MKCMVFLLIISEISFIKMVLRCFLDYKFEKKYISNKHCRASNVSAVTAK